jgi:hypothetical protein
VPRDLRWSWPLVAFEATDALNINTVEDHLELTRGKLQGSGIRCREVKATTLQALVPDTHTIAVPIENLEAVGLTVEEDE